MLLTLQETARGRNRYNYAFWTDFTRKDHRLLKGWVMLSAEGYESDEDLDGWVSRGRDFARSLPEK